MRFLVDAQLPPALARWFDAEGHTAAHVGNLVMGAASDCAIWHRARAPGAAVVIKDKDFARRKALAADGLPVVWIRLPNTLRRDLLVWFAAVPPNVQAALANGKTLIEVP